MDKNNFSKIMIYLNNYHFKTLNTGRVTIKQQLSGKQCSITFNFIQMLLFFLVNRYATGNTPNKYTPRVSSKCEVTKIAICNFWLIFITFNNTPLLNMC